MATTVENRRETSDLIGSDKVEGTAVYGADERKIAPDTGTRAARK